jgi:protein arginine N-methyltransferase 1
MQDESVAKKEKTNKKGPKNPRKESNVSDKKMEDNPRKESNVSDKKKESNVAKKSNKGDYFQADLKKPNFASKDDILESKEKGFIGDKEGWFDNDLWKRPKHKFNFDGAKDHDYYYGSYSSHHIHEEMLKDQSRTMSYQRAIEGNPEDFKDKIVLDIGCGTGILSLFAAKAGAKHVYAVDNAEVALFAKEIIKQNGFEDKITVMKGKIEDLEFPFGEGGVDIIISEWMGYFLLYESMLDCVLWARDKYLNKKTGKMLPDRAQMYVAAIEDSEYMTDKKQFWDNVYGFNMNCMSHSVFKDPVVDTVPSQQIMTDSCCILDLNLVTMKKEEVNFSNYYALTANFTDRVHALVSWFDTTFSDL